MGQLQTSVTQTLKYKSILYPEEMLELMTCCSSQSLSVLMKKQLSVHVKNVLLPDQNGQKPPFREAELKANLFVRDVVTTARGMTEQTFQALEDEYDLPIA